MSFYEDEQARIAEENRHARTGGCIAAILLLLLVPPVCYGLLTFTSGGQALASHAVLYYTYNGLPLAGLTPGLPQLAQQSCALDRNQPANYREQQAALTETYQEYVERYRAHYLRLVELDREIDFHPNPALIPATLNAAKLTYCTP